MVKVPAVLIDVPFNSRAPPVVLILPEAVMVPLLTLKLPLVMVAPPEATVKPVRPDKAPPLVKTAVGLLMKLV